jgi:hypothetical protein
MPDPLPDLQPIPLTAFGSFFGDDHRQRARDLAIETRAIRTLLQVAFDIRFASRRAEPADGASP